MDGCTKRLCEQCPQAECTECGLAHCEDHSIVTKTGPMCPLCFNKHVESGLTPREVMAGELEPEDGQDGRDDDTRGADSYTLGAERCPPRE